MKIKLKPNHLSPGVLSCTGVCLLFAFTPAWGQGTISPVEPNDSISTATETGLTAGATGIKVAYANNGDGLYGLDGDQTGDMDFYKVSAGAGQVIYANINNASADPDFDPYIGIYDSSGLLVAENDDESVTPANPRGYDRTSYLTFTAPSAGDYYICVSSWIDGSTSLPGDPFTPGSGPGLPSGAAADYQLFIGLNANVPVPEFVGGTIGYPVPVFFPTKIFGTPRYDGVVTIRNTGPAPYTITNYAVNGPDAGLFTVTGLSLPLTIAPGQYQNIQVSYNAAGVTGASSATLDFTSNDPFGLKFAMNTYGSPVIGGGKFTVRQVHSTTAINSMFLADDLLSGIGISSEATQEAGGVNYGTGSMGHFANDALFFDTAGSGDNFAIQATGTIYIKTAGTYTFLGYSDDGQRLKVDDMELFSTDGYNTDTFGFADLTAGEHTVEYTMFEAGGADSAELSISQLEGDYADYLDSKWELLEAYSPDADGDGMPNQWEADNGTDPNVNDASLDPDSDGLTNLQEYAAGTKPTVADTDGDGYKDGVETKTGVWVSAANTGSNPLLADTDGDGLLDGAENFSLPYVDAAQTGTDPNKKDTDGDGFADLTEPDLGTDPKNPASTPALVWEPLLQDAFDGPQINSVYGFTSSSGTFAPLLTDSLDPVAATVMQLSEQSNSINNSVAWDAVATTETKTLQLTFDFRFSNETDPADGLGIGLFGTSTYGSAGALNPATGGQNWENPTTAPGFANALVFGFGFYGTDVIRMTGPAAPGVPIAAVGAPFVLTNDLFNRVTITVLPNGSVGAMVKMTIIEDVYGTAVTHTVLDNVLVPGFDVETQKFRLIGGVRTGGANARMDLDAVSLSSNSLAAPTVAAVAGYSTINATVHDGTVTAVNAATLTATLNGAPLPVTASKTGSVTAVDYTGAAGTFLPSGLNTLVFSYNDMLGAPQTSSLTFTTAPYTLIPAALAQAPATAGPPGFNVKPTQMVTIEGTTIPNFLEYAEGIADGVSGTPFIGGNVADLSGAVDGVYTAEVINFEQDGVPAGNFADDVLFPGITGAQGNDNVVLETTTWVNFPAAGVYKFGVNSDDGFRVNYGFDPVPAVRITSPVSRILPVFPGQIYAPFPSPPVTVKLVAAQPAIADTDLTNAAAISGNIALIDRGSVTFSSKVLKAQAAGAVGVIIINETQPDTLPAGMGGDPAGVTIPAVMISKGDGDALKALLAATPAGVDIQYGIDRTTTLGELNGVAVNTVFSAAVSEPGLYPLRLLYWEGGGGASCEWFTVGADGVKHLLNNPADEQSLLAYTSAGTGPAISIVPSGGNVTLQFTGVLQSSPDLTGFTDVPGAVSPYTVPAGSGKLFFRARQ